MIKNKLQSKMGLNSNNDEVEVNSVLLKFDGIEYNLKPGETIDVFDKFHITKDQVPMLEGRFMAKFPSFLTVVDTKKEMERIEKERANDKIAKIKASKTAKEVKDLIKGEKNGDVVNAGIEKVEELGKIK